VLMHLGRAKLVHVHRTEHRLDIRHAVSSFAIRGLALRTLDARARVAIARRTVRGRSPRALTAPLDAAR
jgi:hypothetical protein